MTTRRKFVTGALRGVGAFAAAGLSIASGEVWGSASPDCEKWIDKWTARKQKEVKGELILHKFKDRFWAIRNNPISWWPAVGQPTTLQRVDVPVGFVTDLASVPKIFFSVLPPDGEYGYAAVIHDYLYWTQTVSRADANQVFLLAMRDFGISSVTANLIFMAVDRLGKGPWENNARARANGEKRVLSKFPDDPRITWGQWRKRKDVFTSI